MSLGDVLIPLFVLFVVLNLAGLCIYLERKQSALMQDRLGANTAAIFGIRLLGIFHPVADAIKMFTKEDFIPARANKTLHTFAPFLAVFSPLFAFAFIPFAPNLVVFSHPLSALFALAFSSLGVYGVVLGGWASFNKYALLGALRASAQMLSYEIILSVALLGMALTYGSFDLVQIVKRQQGFFFGFIPKFGVFLQPVLFALFLIASIAETKRIPFDLPEGESEIIGFYTEYSGMKFGAFMMSEFLEIALSSALMVLLFFGGWHLGFDLPTGGILKEAVYAAIFLAKVVVFCFFQLLVRWTLPRLRIDQVMASCWKTLLPIGLANLILTLFVLYGRMG